MTNGRTRNKKYKKDRNERGWKIEMKKDRRKKKEEREIGKNRKRGKEPQGGRGIRISRRKMA